MHYWSATQLRDAFLKGEVKAAQIAEHFLKRIAAYNKELGALLTVFEEKIQIKAETLDRKRALNQPVGPLAAIPIAIKDNMHISGEITTCASKFLSHYRAPFDA